MSFADELNNATQTPLQMLQLTEQAYFDTLNNIYSQIKEYALTMAKQGKYSTYNGKRCVKGYIEFGEDKFNGRDGDISCKPLYSSDYLYGNDSKVILNRNPPTYRYNYSALRAINTSGWWNEEIQIFKSTDISTKFTPRIGSILGCSSGNNDDRYIFINDFLNIQVSGYRFVFDNPTVSITLSQNGKRIIDYIISLGNNDGIRCEISFRLAAKPLTRSDISHFNQTIYFSVNSSSSLPSKLKNQYGVYISCDGFQYGTILDFAVIY